jgi:hypothetical protein
MIGNTKEPVKSSLKIENTFRVNIKISNIVSSENQKVENPFNFIMFFNDNDQFKITSKHSIIIRLALFTARPTTFPKTSFS